MISDFRIKFIFTHSNAFWCACCICCLCILAGATSANAQKFMQIERMGRVKTQRIYPGEVINYRYKGDWYMGEIQDFRFDLGQVVMHNRYLPVTDIEALRYPRTWPRPVGKQLMLFGASWSGWALVGSATDNIPGIDYRWSDAIVSASAVAAGLALPAVVKKYKVVEMGKRRRLRLMDLTM